MLSSNIIGNWSVGRTTATANTAFTWFVPPWGGAPGEPRKLYKVDTGQTVGPFALTGKPNWQGETDGFTKVTHLNIINGSTSHTIKVLRPLNWTYFKVAVAKNITAIPNATLSEDPGVYSTNYRYPTPGNNAPTQVADAAISSTNNLVMYQLADGTWVLDTIASGTFGASLTLTTGTPNRTGATILANSPLFYFGANTLADPATGLTLGFDTTLSSTQDLVPAVGDSLWSGLHRGDPLVFYDANATAADVMAGMFGVYTKDW